jgi:PAS domain S-box-containing protein
MPSVTNPSTTSLAWDAFSPTPLGASKTIESPLQLLARLGREAAITSSPRALALQVAQAAASMLRASHYGVAEILSDGQRLNVHVHSAALQFSAGKKSYEVRLAAENSHAAAALRRGETLVEYDLATSHNSDDELQALGLHAALVTPLASLTHTYGALAVYHDAPREFEPEQVALVEALASLVTGALARFRAESVAQQKTAMEEALFHSMESLLILLTAKGDILQTNFACQAVTGFSDASLCGRSIWSALMLPEELSAVKRALVRIEKEKSIERFETYILTSEGLRRRIAWTAAPLGSALPQAGTILLTGIDITDRCEAIERSARAEAMAQDARRMCNELQDRIKLGEALLDGTAPRRLPQGVEHDRRARSRRPYPYVQRIAPMRGTAMPDETQFNEWLCHDISSRGFSFISPNQPDYHKIVVAFGTPPSLVYLTADVRHATRCEENGRTQFVVGCRYTGRISKNLRGGKG